MLLREIWLICVIFPFPLFFQSKATKVHLIAGTSAETLYEDIALLPGQRRDPKFHAPPVDVSASSDHTT
jgi:hypothetical protein